MYCTCLIYVSLFLTELKAYSSVGENLQIETTTLYGTPINSNTLCLLSIL